MSDSETISIVVSNTDRSPRITSTPATELVEPDLTSFKATYGYAAHAIDPDGDAVTFSLTEKPEGADIDPATGFVTWKPNRNQLGLNSFTLAASDGVLASTQSWTVDVKLPERIVIPRQALMVEQVALPDCIMPGVEDTAFITLKNLDVYPQKDLTVSAVSLELDYQRQAGPFSLKAGESKTAAILFEVPPNTQPGIYDLAVTAKNGMLRRTKYLEFTVKDRC
ncbi:hypothetical protein HYY72_02600 [Candidatus Woesearchaeota archaeon]|nr:hypothetical protein [Candidatus Woesearchaeota archaeon]